MRKSCYFIGTPTGPGAVAAYFAALGSELARRGNEVRVITPRAGKPPERSVSDPAMLVWPSPRPTRLADAVFLAGLIRRYRPDCLIANFAAVNWMCVVGWIFRVRNRIAFYHTLSTQIEGDRRQGGPLPRLRILRKKYVYKTATAIAGISQAALRDVQQAYGVTANKCSLWRCSMPDPANRMKLLSADEREDLLVCPGRFSPSKGQDVLISALALLPPSAAQTRVEFLGSGPTLEGLRQQARQAGVADRCLFTGSVAHDEVLRRMSRARATIVPSRDEAFGLVNIESLSVGTPVIASNVGGIPEIIRDGVEGFLVPSGDSKVLAEKIARLLPDCGLRERLGLNARQRFLNEYEDAAVVRKQADWLEHSVSCDEVEGVRV